MGKMKKKYLYEEQVKEIVNRHSFFQEEEWEISFREIKSSLHKKSSKTEDWSRLKSHTPDVK
jgi:hypothetical protein